MKKAVLFCIIALICVSCSPLGRDHFYWRVHNGTGQVLKFEFPYYSKADGEARYRVVTLNGQEEITVGESWSKGNDNIPFDRYFEMCANLQGENVYWRILSETGEVLKTWTYSEKDEPDQRFFYEPEWGFNPEYSEWGSSSGFWGFVVIPDDIK